MYLHTFYYFKRGWVGDYSSPEQVVLELSINLARQELYQVTSVKGCLPTRRVGHDTVWDKPH